MLGRTIMRALVIEMRMIGSDEGTAEFDCEKYNMVGEDNYDCFLYIHFSK